MMVDEPHDPTQSKADYDSLHFGLADYATLTGAPAPLINGEDKSDHRTPPLNYEAEAGLLAAILSDNDAYDSVADILRPLHFADAVHGRIFAACATLIDGGRTADAVTLKAIFDKDEALDEGAQYLNYLQANPITTIANAGDYGRTIYDLFLRRELIAIGEDLVTDSYDVNLERSAETILEDTQAGMDKVIGAGAQDSGDLIGSYDAVTRALLEIEEARRRHETGRLSGLTTGLRSLDRLTAGLHPGELTVLAGRPAMGKSALAAGIAHVNATLGHAVAFFSLEMTAAQISKRLLSLRTGIPFSRIRSGDLDDDEAQRLTNERERMGRLPLAIDESRARTVSAIRSRARRFKRKNGLALIVIDYLQLMTGSGRDRRQRWEEVGEMTRDLKMLAGEMACPVLALSQLSRALESRDDKRPQLSDLRESGSIEQDADNVIFVYREEEYLRNREPVRRENEKDPLFADRVLSWEGRLAAAAGKADVIVAKQREGPTGTIKLDVDMARMRFADVGELPELGEAIPF